MKDKDVVLFVFLVFLLKSQNLHWISSGIPVYFQWQSSGKLVDSTSFTTKFGGDSVDPPFCHWNASRNPLDF
uniref:Uncharacterized protein n=1 Tax=Ditylenchus dipsaci TaxID=166011 RepID=A0A915DGV0_9BILA